MGSLGRPSMRYPSSMRWVCGVWLVLALLLADSQQRVDGLQAQAASAVGSASQPRRHASYHHHSSSSPRRSHSPAHADAAMHSSQHSHYHTAEDRRDDSVLVEQQARASAHTQHQVQRHTQHQQQHQQRAHIPPANVRPATRTTAATAVAAAAADNSTNSTASEYAQAQVLKDHMTDQDPEFYARYNHPPTAQEEEEEDEEGEEEEEEEEGRPARRARRNEPSKRVFTHNINQIRKIQKVLQMHLPHSHEEDVELEKAFLRRLTEVGDRSEQHAAAVLDNEAKMKALEAVRHAHEHMKREKEFAQQLHAKYEEFEKHVSESKEKLSAAEHRHKDLVREQDMKHDDEARVKVRHEDELKKQTVESIQQEEATKLAAEEKKKSSREELQKRTEKHNKRLETKRLEAETEQRQQQ